MYMNLMREMSRKNLSNKAVAAALGCSEKTLYNKYTGATEFNWSEVKTIKKDLLPEFDLEYLFEEEK